MDDNLNKTHLTKLALEVGRSVSFPDWLGNRTALSSLAGAVIPLGIDGNIWKARLNVKLGSF